MKISVIVPIYNVEKYLSRAIDSIINQDYKNIEIILVDDGSTDKCGTICDKYASNYNNIKVIHKTNGGVSSAFNEGIKIATGDCFTAIGSDDWVDTDHISFLVDCQKQYPEALVSSGYNEIVCGQLTAYPIKKGVVIFNRKEALLRLFDGGNFEGFIGNKLFNLKLVRDNNLFLDEELLSCQDIHFVFKYIQIIGKLVFFSDAKYYYERDGHGVMVGGLTKRRLTRILAYQEMLQMARDEGEDIEQKVGIATFETALGLITCYYENKVKNPELLKELKIIVKDNAKYIKKSSGISHKKSLRFKLASISPYIFYVASKIIFHIKKRVKV